MPSDGNTTYTLCTNWEGSNGAVNALLFSEDGKRLICGGDDERLRIFNTDSLKCEKTVHCEKWGQVTALTWVHVDHPIDEKSTSLCVGSARGLVTLWTLFNDIDDKLAPWKEARTCPVFTFNDAVEALAYDRLNSRLATTSHSGHVKLFDVDKLVLKPIWAINTGNDIPRAVFFFGGAKQFLLTLALESGEMCCRESQSSNVVWTKILGGGIGNAALSPDETTLLVDNLTTKNFDVYRLPDNVPSTFLPFSSTRRFPKQCIFSGGAKVAVCGSDNNSVYVVDVTTSEGIQTLRCGEAGEMMQTIAANTAIRSRLMIACGSSNGNVYLWDTKETSDPTPADSQNTPTINNNSSETVRPASRIPVDVNILILVIFLTYKDWVPYFWKFVAMISEAVGPSFSTAIGR